VSTSTSGRPHDVGVYEIHVTGRLDKRWSTWLDGTDITPGGDGTTVLHSGLVDQAALHGLLSRLRDLGLPLLSVTLLQPGTQDATHLDSSTGG
jgi:hypothetical protein